jgi:hypothetical protein
MMADDRTARPVSGEIMTAPATLAAAAPGAVNEPADFIDADYVVMPHLAAADGAVPAPPPGVISTPIAGMDMLRKPDSPAERPPPSRGGPIFWTAGVCIIFGAFWVSGGHALLRHASILSVRQASVLTISGVRSHVDAVGAQPVLFVAGEAANDGSTPAPLPALEIRVDGNDGRSTRYTLGTSGRWLASGERFGFSSRLDVPKNGVKTVSVGFAP